MPKPEWGVKRTCLSCAARFYDLMRDPIICPKCGAEYDASALSKPKRMKAEKATKEAPAAPYADSDALVEEDVGEDDADLGSDDDSLIEDDDSEAEPAPAKAGAVDDEDDDETLGDFDSDPLLEEDDTDDTDDLDDVAPAEDRDDDNR